MERIRKPFQGIWNIIRFNWHFYLISTGFVLLILLLNNSLPEPYRLFVIILFILIIGTTLTSLLVSFYVYDLSDLYTLNWLDLITVDPHSKIINVNAGFDETSILLKDRYPDAEFQVFDFYDSSKHTEVSIKRARKAYPPFPNTRSVSTSGLPLQDNYTDKVFVILSAHEIRTESERDTFFNELKRVLKQTGNIVVTEHLRDLPNFLAYNIGFFHFIPKASWYRTFRRAGLSVHKEIKITPFISTFILGKYGATS
jgi:ubiquinone/menaquinone biosynthesis C-methylase UbiE